MSFLTHLESIVEQVDGAIACSVMGFDGIAVETHQRRRAAGRPSSSTSTAPGSSTPTCSRSSKNAADRLKTGAVAELSVNSEKLITLMRLVNQDYFVVLGLLPDGNYGKGALRAAHHRAQADGRALDRRSAKPATHLPSRRVWFRPCQAGPCR